MNGNIPVLTVKGKCLAEAWENSMLMLYHEGCDIKTEYDKKEDPPSKDSTMMVVVEDPASEPFIHRAFPGGPADLEEYRQEVVEGIKDNWVRDPNDPEDTRWEYTYHGRLFKYEYIKYAPPMLDEFGVKQAEQYQHLYNNQIKEMIEKLAKTPYSRRCNAITWKVSEDPKWESPPCLQSIWCRVHVVGHTWYLNMNVRFRSRDAYDAAFMNMYAFIYLQEYIADEISKLAGRPVELGRFCDLSDSYHIYGHRLADFEQRFMGLLKTRTFADRTWTRGDIADMIVEARPMIAEKVRQKNEDFEQRGLL